jgi:hypothetical protein
MKFKALILVFFIIAPLSQFACSQAPSPQITTSSQLVLDLSGSGDAVTGSSVKTSQNFHISKSQWFIETTCNALGPSTSVFFSVAVYPKDEIMLHNIVGAALQITPGTAVNYVHKAGDFYLVIGARNVKNWSVKVYQ